MSLVICIGNEDYIMFCGESRVCDNNVPIEEKMKKVHKINDYNLIGFTGILADIEFIAKGIILKSGILEAAKFLSNIELREMLNNNCREIQQLKEKGQYSSDASAVITLAGWDDRCFRIDQYSVKEEKINSKILDSKLFEIMYSGNNHQHKENFTNHLTKYKERKKSLDNIKSNSVIITRLDIKNAFRDTLDDGLTFDGSINNDYMFEIIKRPV